MSGQGKIYWVSRKNQFEGVNGKRKKNGYCTMTYGDKIVYKGILGEDKRNVEGKF